MKNKIYLDYAATTPTDKKVLKKILPYFTENFGNTSSLHQQGVFARRALEEARQTIALFLKAKPNEIIFTSSATESNNLALKGVALANKEKGQRILISAIEHDSVQQAAFWLKKQGFAVEEIPVDKEGFIKLDKLEKMIQPDTILVSVIHGNNEIGTIQKIKTIAKICRKHKVLFHTDAAQSFGRIPLSTEQGFDLLTASSHKVYGPKGAGLLYVKQGVKIEPLLHGGGHEFGLRASTVNVAAIVGFAEAIKIYQKTQKEELKRISQLRDKLIEKILKNIRGSHLTGPKKNRLPHIASFYFDHIEGESLIMMLDQYGIAASTGSACSSKNLKPSSVLLACGLSPVQAHGSLRLSLGRQNSEEDIKYTVSVLKKIVQKLRKISPYA